MNLVEWTGPGATMPELLISAICLRALEPWASHNLGRNTPIHN
jgi:hypothetical protein